MCRMCFLHHRMCSLVINGHAHAPHHRLFLQDELEKVVVATGRIEQANLDPATLQAFAVRGAGRTYSAAPDTGPSLGFITMPAPVRRSDTTLHCLPMSLPSGKAFAAEPAPSDLRMDQAAGREKLFHDLVDSINCFEPVSWSALAKDVLLPWASSSRGRSKLLLDLIRDLVGLGDALEDGGVTVWAFVWVVLQGFLPVRFLDVGGRCGARH